MEVIRGLRIGDGSVIPQYINFEVDTDSIAYVTLPNGVLLTSVGGIIDYDWTGKDGAVLLVTKKIHDYVKTIGTTIYGTFKYNGGELLVINECGLISKVIANNARSVNINDTSIVSVNCKKAGYLNAGQCGLTAQSLGNFMLDAIANNRTRAGTLIATGGTNAGATAINSYLVTQGTTLASVLTQLSTWTINLNA